MMTPLPVTLQTMKLVGEDVQEQAKQALTNIGHILEEAGSSFANVVKTTVLLADIKDYPKVNEIYATCKYTLLIY
jgi:2-iminobutanoate/2-iminopropanoate deaminase